MLRVVFYRLALLACGLGLLVASATTAQAEDSLMPAGWDANLKLPEAVDINPDPRIVEINLEAKLAKVEVAPGKVVEAWTYNGSIPGPLIRVNVGDRLIVHFTNHLPKPTTVHWHGVRVPIQMDGVPGYSQSEVQTGGKFTYDFVIIDAGLYWYHPHVDSAAQVGFGLYGALLVQDPKENVGVADELVIVLSDMGIDDHGHLSDPNSGGALGMVFGREGNSVLVNGRTDRKLTARAGVPQRWRILNASKSRYFSLRLRGQTFTVIGTDGGLQEYPTETSELVIGTAERLDVIVTPKVNPDSELSLFSYLYNRGYGSVEYRDPRQLLFTIKFNDSPAFDAPPLPQIRRTIEPLDLRNATRVEMQFTLDKQPDGGVLYGINGVPFSRAKPFVAKEGETQIWTLINKTAWTHPFHLHGFFFQVLDENEVPVRPLAWKDTVTVPFEKTVKVAVRFDEGRPGKWMMHCHILDHGDGGLMGTVEVGTPPPDHPSTTGHGHAH